jgi:hypothetical protein
MKLHPDVNNRIAICRQNTVIQWTGMPPHSSPFMDSMLGAEFLSAAPLCAYSQLQGGTGYLNGMDELCWPEGSMYTCVEEDVDNVDPQCGALLAIPEEIDSMLLSEKRMISAVTGNHGYW